MAPKFPTAHDNPPETDAIDENRDLAQAVTRIILTRHRQRQVSHLDRIDSHQITEQLKSEFGLGFKHIEVLNILLAFRNRGYIEDTFGLVSHFENEPEEPMEIYRVYPNIRQLV